ncbi:CsbD family protein [Sporichthya polymorpha]|uniref:CsbD family protein n=1 Tax=Sporichthya polymorpha TaxID=35751 RepID=UPI00037DA8CF|nr:CsbD family protein [Sporichthya polymorpha]
MGATDKLGNAIDDAAGKAKETAGRMGGDRDMEAEGQGDQAKAQVKKAGENVKDAAKKLMGD